MSQVIKLTKFVAVENKVEIINEHPADNKFLDCAIAANADYIVSGDKHILNVVTYRKIKMLTVNDFLELLSSS
jgi:uncharacterized protein